jgi:putative glycerol-1-phosphate prenyltransferase
MPSEDDTIAYAYMAEHMYKLPVFYLENSGAYADPELVQKVKRQLSNTLLFYGGGITSAEQAAEMKQHADVIIVGNHVYDNIKAALKTVKAVKG